MGDMEAPADGLPPLKDNAVVAVWRGYNRLLKAQPLMTKSVTASVMAALGELIGSQLRKAGPGTRAERLKRLWAFTVFGLLVNGPVFHFWYSALERAAARWARLTGGRQVVLFKIALDRLLLTPPYLALTLIGLRWLQDFNFNSAARACAAIYRPALLTNWRVWTAAQLINFNYVPLEFRVLFGNAVAVVWNMYLSLAAS